MDTKEKMDFLAGFDDFWSHLRDEDKSFVCKNTEYVSYHPGQNVHSRDTQCIGLLFLETGSLRVYIMSEEGKEVTLYRVSAGEVCIMSASCVLSEITFDVYIDAEEYTTAVLLNAFSFKKLIDKNIYIENFSNKMKAIRFSDVMWTMQQILFFSFDKRLAIFLYDEMVKNGPVIRYSHMEIAKYLGSAREVVSRMLKYFENEGIVTVSRKEIIITDKRKLKEHI
jgi:CRP/FNR family transcriptional regulator